MLPRGTILGHYRLLQRIGVGGMGKVYLAEDTRIARHVAIKIVLTEPQPYPNSAAVQEASRLFRREMKAIAMLDHRNILNLIGLIAIYTNNSTEVTYRDARVWTL